MEIIYPQFKRPTRSEAEKQPGITWRFTVGLKGDAGHIFCAGSLREVFGGWEAKIDNADAWGGPGTTREKAVETAAWKGYAQTAKKHIETMRWVADQEAAKSAASALIAKVNPQS